MSNKLLTAILPSDADALAIVRRLKEERGVVAVNVNSARGLGHITRDRAESLESGQREILTVVVPSDEADGLFDWLREAADIDRPHGGILYQQTLAEATEYTLPDVPDEEGDADG